MCNAPDCVLNGKSVCALLTAVTNTGRKLPNKLIEQCINSFERTIMFRGISILNTCYKIYSKILNMKLQKYLEAFMTETTWIPKGTAMHGPNILP
jgi:hypothetical protein